MEQSFSTESWPAGHRAALLVVVRVVAPDDAGDVPLAGIDYSATGLQNILHTLADLDVTTTTAWSDGALAASPQLARLALDEGHDVIPLGAAGATRSLVERLTGTTPTGSMFADAPAGASGPLWAISERGGDLPIIIGENAVSIPTSPFWHDTAWFDPLRPSPPSALLETWSQGLQSVRSSGQLMTIVLHPHLSGRPGLLEAIARFLDEAIGAGDVWMPRGSDLAAWWLSRSPVSTEED